MEPSGRGARSSESASRTAQAPIGQTIGRYRIGKLLGEGAMGRVYQARDPELGREVAIKILRLDAAGNARDAYIARFRNEARAAARFQHPNVVAVYDAGVDPNYGPFLVYEFIAGPTLRARLERERKLPLHEVALLARGVGAALDALHAAGIIHRDIKPDNILLAPDGTVKLTDFGIARVPDAQLTREGQFLGTPAYAAPEAITKGEYSVRGDAFSLAAVLYEALCGVRPFPGDDAVSVSYAVANDTPPPPSVHVGELPTSVDAVFARALAKRQGERFASAGELAIALLAAARTNAATASAISAATASATMPVPVRRPQHPRPVEPETSQSTQPERPLLAIGVLVVVVAVLAIMVARRLGRTDGEVNSEAGTHQERTTTAPPTRPGTRVRAVQPRAQRDAGVAPRVRD